MVDARFTTTHQRVLALLSGHTGRCFFTKEFIDLTDGGTGAVQRELARRRESSLVVQTTQGNQKHYQANPGSPIFEELCCIVAKTLGLAETFREALSPLAAEARRLIGLVICSRTVKSQVADIRFQAR